MLGMEESVESYRAGDESQPRLQTSKSQCSYFEVEIEDLARDQKLSHRDVGHGVRPPGDRGC